MSVVLFIYAIGALCLAVGLTAWWRTAPTAWHGSVAALGAWIQFACIVFYSLNGHGGG